MPETVEDTIERVFDDMKFETLIGWADMLNVPHNEDEWSSDEWLDKEGELRVQVAAAMIRFLEKT